MRAKYINENFSNILKPKCDEEIWNDVEDIDINYLLQKFCRTGFLYGVKKVIEKGANINVYGDEALITASGEGYTEIVKLLLEKGANVHAEIDSPLNDAIFYRHIDTIKILLNAGADVHAHDGYFLETSKRRTDQTIYNLLVNNEFKSD